MPSHTAFVNQNVRKTYNHFNFILQKFWVASHNIDFSYILAACFVQQSRNSKWLSFIFFIVLDEGTFPKQMP